MLGWELGGGGGCGCLGNGGPLDETTPGRDVDVHLRGSWDILSLLLQDFTLALELRLS